MHTRQCCVFWGGGKGGRGEDERWSECTHEQGPPGWGFVLLVWPVTKRSGAAQQLHDAGTASCLLTR